MAIKNKFGSPYSGKQMRPQDKKEQEERRQHQLCGCGDPNCPLCNPETASMSDGLFGGERPTEMSVPMVDLNREALKQMYRGGAGETGNRPPNSYRLARRKVEKFICVAQLTGVPTGVTAKDVMTAVNALFEENRGLEHEYALDEFKQEFYDEVQADRRKNMN